MKNLTLLAILIAALFLLAGCGGGDEAETTAKETTPAAETTTEHPAASEHPAAEHPSAADTETAAVHDCDGACGMKDVPMDKLTEVGGKYFCAGCVDKAKEAAAKGAGHG